MRDLGSPPPLPCATRSRPRHAGRQHQAGCAALREMFDIRDGVSLPNWFLCVFNYLFVFVFASLSLNHSCLKFCVHLFILLLCFVCGAFRYMFGLGKPKAVNYQKQGACLFPMESTEGLGGGYRVPTQVVGNHGYNLVGAPGLFIRGQPDRVVNWVHDHLHTVHCPTVDGRNPAPKKPWNDDYPVTTHKQWFPWLLRWCRIWSMHSMITHFRPTSPLGFPCILFGLGQLL